MDTPQNHIEYQIQQAFIFKEKLFDAGLHKSAPIGMFLFDYLKGIMEIQSDCCLAIANKIAAIKEATISPNQLDVVFFEVLDYLYIQKKTPIIVHCINSLVLQIGNSEDFTNNPYTPKLIEILDDLDTNRNYEFAWKTIISFMSTSIQKESFMDIMIVLMSHYGKRNNPQIFMILHECIKDQLPTFYEAIKNTLKDTAKNPRCLHAFMYKRYARSEKHFLATEQKYYNLIQKKSFEKNEIDKLLHCYNDYIRYLADIHGDEREYSDLENNWFNFRELQSSAALNLGFGQFTLEKLCLAHPLVARLLNLTRFASEMNVFFKKTYDLIKNTPETEWKTKSWSLFNSASFTQDKAGSVKKIEKALQPYATPRSLSLYELFKIYEQLNIIMNALDPYPLEALESTFMRQEEAPRPPNLKDGRHPFTRNFLINVINGLNRLEGFFPARLAPVNAAIKASNLVDFDSDFCVIENANEEQLYNKFIGTFAPGTKFTDEEFKELMQFYSELLQGIINDPSRHPQNLPDELKPEEFQKWLNGCFNFHFPHLSCVMFNMTSMQQPFDIIRESNPFIQRLFNICTIMSLINQFVSNVQADIKTAETKTKGNTDSGLYVKMMGDSFAEGTPETVDALIKIINRYLEDRESTEFSKTIKAYIEMKNILTPLLSTIHLPDPNRHRNTRKLYYDVLSKWIELFNMIAGLNNNITTNQKCRKYPLLPPFQEEVKKPGSHTAAIQKIENESEETDSGEESELREGYIRVYSEDESDRDRGYIRLNKIG